MPQTRPFLHGGAAHRGEYQGSTQRVRECHPKGSLPVALNPPGESGDSKLIETMLPHRYSDRYRRYAPISQAAYLRSIHTGAGC